MLVIIMGLSGIFVSSFRYDSIETRTYFYESTVSEVITLSKVENITIYSILIRDSKNHSNNNFPGQHYE